MNPNKQTNYDLALRTAITQDVTADVNGKDSGGVDIVLNMENWKGQALMVNAQVLSIAATTVCDIYAESSDDITFATGVFSSEVININQTPALTTPKAFGPAGFVPLGKYARIRFDWTSGTLTDVTAWFSTTG